MTQRGRDIADRLAVAIGSFGLTGFFPVAPATFASAVSGVLLAYLYPLGSSRAYVAVALALLLAGVWAATRMERLYGHDPSAVVLDEVLGMALTLAWAPITPMTVAIGFALFRIFDILKVFPGRALERLPAGWGVMADDACAGIYAALVLQALLRLWPEPRFALWQLGPAGIGVVLLLAFRKPLLRRYGKKRSHLRAGFAAAHAGEDAPGGER